MSSYLGLAPLETAQHINNNHMDMCRFKGHDGVEFQKVAAALLRLTASINTQGGESDASRTLSECQRAKLLESLQFEQIDSRFKSVKRAHADTCRWFLTSREYLDWLDPGKRNGHYGFLWMKGKPGAGKSMLMKLLCNSSRLQPRDKLCFFFNARGVELERTTVGMYRSLLLQLLQPRPRLQVAFDAAGLMGWNATDSHTWSVESLKEVLEEAVCRLGKSEAATCFIDALDECPGTEARDMVRFLEHLSSSAT
jgi:hypothetical protein